jgi:hypothetical protein
MTINPTMDDRQNQTLHGITSFERRFSHAV